jgi:hypothetical protein
VFIDNKKMKRHLPENTLAGKNKPLTTDFQNYCILLKVGSRNKKIFHAVAPEGHYAVVVAGKICSGL